MGLKDILKDAEGSLILYNITFDLSDERTILIPCIPESAGEGEDKTTPRVCMADSIEHCICAIASGNRDLRVGSRIVVRKAMTSSISVDKLLDYKSLYEQKKVPDALDTHEYWVCEPVSVCRTVYVISSFDHEFAVNWRSIPSLAVRSIAKGYVDSNICTGDSAYEIYNRVTKYLQENDRYADSDDFYEDILEIPWAQGHVVKNLHLIEV